VRGCSHLALRYEDSDVPVHTRGDGKVGHALGAQFVPDGREVVAIVKLDLIRHHAGAEALVVGVLQVPARCRFLNESAKRLLLGPLVEGFNGAPDLEILSGVSILILGRALPGAQEGASRGETEVVNGLDRQVG